MERRQYHEYHNAAQGRFQRALLLPVEGCAGEAQDLLSPAHQDARALKTDLPGTASEALPDEQEDRETGPRGSAS